MDNIVDTAVNAGSFSTLVAAIKAAQLVDTLKGAVSFTIGHLQVSHYRF